MYNVLAHMSHFGVFGGVAYGINFFPDDGGVFKVLEDGNEYIYK